MRALVVDDSQIMRRIIVKVLNQVGVKDTVEASNGVEAVVAVEADTSIKLVLLDWNMPVMNGLEALKKIRTMNKEILIIMVTTEGEKEKVMEAFKNGANDYLLKPFEPRGITDKLTKFSAVLGQ